MFVTSGIDYQETSGVSNLRHDNPRSTTHQSRNGPTTHHTSRHGVDTMPAL